MPLDELDQKLLKKISPWRDALTEADPRGGIFAT
jgi:hypothetical protein